MELTPDMPDVQRRAVDLILDRKLELNAELVSLHGRLASYLAVPDWVADTTQQMFEGDARQELMAVAALERARDDLAGWLALFEGDVD